MDKTTKRDKIIEFVCAYYCITKDKLKEQDLEREQIVPRHVCAYYLRNYVGMSYKNIAPLTGYKEHSAVIYGCGKVKKQILNKDKDIVDFHNGLVNFMGDGFKEVKTMMQSNKSACGRKWYSESDEARDRALVEGWKNGTRKIGVAPPR